MTTAVPALAATQWLANFSAALQRRDAAAAAALFHEDCHWRDLLAFTWNIKTLEGRDAIERMLEATVAIAQPFGWAITGEPTSDGKLIETWFSFETGFARGEGVVGLSEGKCHTLFTSMTELKGFEEKRGPTRPLGVSHQADPKRETWTDARRRGHETLGYSQQPYVLVVGGGQGGIALGARLKQLGVPTIVLEKNARAGDSWRNRYRSLVLHDPVWFDHLPYIPFPAHWPVFTPKDKLGDWLEMYTLVMELNYWTHSTCTHASYDAEAKEWTVEVDRKGERVVLRPKQLVFATGATGPARRIDLPGMQEFRGEILHSSEYAEGSKFRGKKVAVIGAGSSGHDVCVDLWESGAEVTMIQRSPTTVVRVGTLQEVGMQLYSEGAVAAGVTTEKADLIAASLPYTLFTQLQKQLTARIRERDAAFYESLQATGFMLDFGEDDSGLVMKAYRTASGYYIDVGGSDLIINGAIKLKTGVSIAHLRENGIIFDDGSELAADAIIACTGYKSILDTVAQIVSREVADKVGPCLGLGSGVRGDPGPWKGEIRNMWKPTRQEALWFHGGNLALSRCYSKYLALQLKARMEGLPTPVYGGPG
jgi:putative flavoprotein involved in K+ transport